MEVFWSCEEQEEHVLHVSNNTNYSKNIAKDPKDTRTKAKRHPKKEKEQERRSVEKKMLSQG